MSLPRYPKYKDSSVEWLGEVPEHWDTSTLKRMARTELSNIDKKTADGETSVRLCNYLDVYRNQTITANLDFMAASASAEQIARLSLRQGDVIITKDSETPDDIGVPALVAESLEGVVCGYHLALLRMHPGVANGSYIARTLQSAFLRAQFATSAVGMTRFGLGKYEIENAIVPKPPIWEQTQIAAFLDRETAMIDALVEEQRRLIELLKEKRQAVISHAVTKGLNPDAPMKDSGIEWLGEIPGHWKVGSIKRWFSTTSGGTPPTDRPEEFYTDAGGFPWIRTTDLNNGVLDTFEVSITEKAISATACSMLPKGCVLVAMYGGEGTIGKNSLLAIPACINQAVCALVPNAEFSERFTHRYIEFFRPYWMIGAESSRKDPNISQDLIRNAAILCPPGGEQLAIADYLDSETARIDRLTFEAQHAIDLLQERRTALISAAVTGKIDVRGIAKEQTA